MLKDGAMALFAWAAVPPLSFALLIVLLYREPSVYTHCWTYTIVCLYECDEDTERFSWRIALLLPLW